jgi:hypothetical protein
MALRLRGWQRASVRGYVTVEEAKKKMEERRMVLSSLGPSVPQLTAPVVPEKARQKEAAPFYLPDRPASTNKSYLLRQNGPAHLTMPELLNARLLLLPELQQRSQEVNKAIWALYGTAGVSLTLALGLSGVPLYGIAVGAWFGVLGGSLALHRQRFFGSLGPETETTIPLLSKSPAGEMYENIVNYSLLNNARAALKPWEHDIPNEWNDIQTDLNGFTALQQLLVKEPIYDRTLRPRVVSNSSSRIIWANLMEENLFYLEESNPWAESLTLGGVKGRFLGWYLRRCVRPTIEAPQKEAAFGISRQIDGDMQTFDLFYESFLQSSISVMRTAGNANLVDRDWPHLLASAVLFGIPALLV